MIAQGNSLSAVLIIVIFCFTIVFYFVGKKQFLNVGYYSLKNEEEDHFD